jgi:hypothetical protein
MRLTCAASRLDRAASGAIDFDAALESRARGTKCEDARPERARRAMSLGSLVWY